MEICFILLEDALSIMALKKIVILLPASMFPLSCFMMKSLLFPQRPSGNLLVYSTKTARGIYEGDIVEQIVTNGYGFGFIGEVGFDNGVFGIKHKTYKGYIVSSFVYSSDWNDGHAHGTVLYEYELKGNIYDNPELIKEEL